MQVMKAALAGWERQEKATSMCRWQNDRVATGLLSGLLVQNRIGAVAGQGYGAKATSAIGPSVCIRVQAMHYATMATGAHHPGRL